METDWCQLEALTVACFSGCSVLGRAVEEMLAPLLMVLCEYRTLVPCRIDFSHANLLVIPWWKETWPQLFSNRTRDWHELQLALGNPFKAGDEFGCFESL